MSRVAGEAEDPGTWESLRTLLRALRWVAPFRWAFAGKLFLLLLTLMPALIIPWPAKILIDHVISGVPVDEPIVPYPFFVAPFVDALVGLSPLGILGACIGFLALMMAVFGTFGADGSERDRADARMAGGYDQATRTENEANEGWSFAGGIVGLLDFRFTMRLTQALNHHYRRALFQRVQSLPMTAFDDERIGDAVYRVLYDTPAITNAAYRLILTPIAAPLLILVTAWMLREAYGDHPTLYWSAAAFAPLALVLSIPLAGIVRRRAARGRRAGAVTTSTAEEGISNILAVQSLGGEGRQRDRFDRDSWRSFSAYRDLMLAGIVTFLACTVPGGWLAANGFLYVTDRVAEGVFSPGDFALLFGFFLRILFAAVDLGGLWLILQGNAAGLQRVFFLMDLESEKDPPGAGEMPPLREGIRIEHVDFDYPDGTPALRDVSLDARIGEMVALVGPAGAGKTSLASLIPRFIVPTRGRVLADGRDLAGWSLASVRAQTAFVFQATVLFDGTIADNLRLARPDARHEEMEQALRRADAWEFVERLPRGLETPLGRAGGRLSVGQRQRLSIARGLVRGAPILVLDEPTSALDPDTERRLVETLQRAKRDHLVLVIAHRLSTIREADQILFLDGGRVVERGSHEELLRRPGGAYRRFIEMQTLGAA